ncbi:MAG: NAD(+)/NADH kinase [Candidatus Nezhaarchaeota archaeon]|nr:NAD(+)/NADH kinase [Candidatus Nezhaarchaeota archaeon]MCX8141945.1 NAD(+)/NADH kinase [Candidatus Nezhaarchaeota archaeon]
MTARSDLRRALRLVESLCAYLKDKNVNVAVDEEVARLCESAEVRASASSVELLKKLDVIITIGGDGTILHTIRKLKPPLRLLSVNVGSMGFLCEIEPEEIHEAIDKLLRGKYQLQRINLLSVYIDGVKADQALNDVLVFTSVPAKVIDLIVRADGIEIFSGRADGVLISSSIGSTAYIVSLGGPLVDPEVKCMIVAVLNPLKLGVRPLILPESSTIQVTFPRRSKRGAAVYSDGVLTRNVDPRGLIEVKVSHEYVDFIRMKDVRHTFYRKFYKVRIRGGRRD